MSSWQFWLLMFSMWHSTSINHRAVGSIGSSIGVILWAGSFIMLIVSLFI